jgi:hypothetical protein
MKNRIASNQKPFKYQKKKLPDWRENPQNG